MYNDDLKIILEHYNVYDQIVVAIEEMSELAKVLCKAYRKGINTTIHKELVEEIADVEIMIEQMKIAFDVWDGDIKMEKEWKIKRQLRRIEDEGRN